MTNVTLLVEKVIPEWVNDKILSAEQLASIKSARAIYVRILRAMNVTPKALLVGFVLAEHMSEKTCATGLGLRTLRPSPGCDARRS